MRSSNAKHLAMRKQQGKRKKKPSSTPSPKGAINEISCSNGRCVEDRLGFGEGVARLDPFHESQRFTLPPQLASCTKLFPIIRYKYAEENAT